MEFLFSDDLLNVIDLPPVPEQRASPEVAEALAAFPQHHHQLLSLYPKPLTGMLPAQLAEVTAIVMQFFVGVIVNITEVLNAGWNLLSVTPHGKIKKTPMMPIKKLLAQTMLGLVVKMAKVLFGLVMIWNFGLKKGPKKKLNLFKLQLCTTNLWQCLTKDTYISGNGVTLPLIGKFL